MKVLIINGSPRVGGNTSIALDEMVKRSMDSLRRENISGHITYVREK